MLHTLVKRHPEFEYTTTVRSKQSESKVKALLPEVTVLTGDLNEYVLLRALPAL